MWGVTVFVGMHEHNVVEKQNRTKQSKSVQTLEEKTGAGSRGFYILWSPGAPDHLDGYGNQLSVPLTPQNRKTV